MNMYVLSKSKLESENSLGQPISPVKDLYASLMVLKQALALGTMLF